MEILSDSPEATRRIGEVVGRALRAGMVLCLTGDLGAGKTLLTKGIAAGLGVKEDVTSPSFTLMNLYAGRLSVAHFDLYRLEEEDALEDIGFYEYAEEPSGVAIIEWADKFPEALPDRRLTVALSRGEGEAARRITFTDRGDGYEDVLAALRDAFPEA
ncbi:MAG: tRNA (adenosine(37)-N6)-threonylcarbamoyltransferase complex ATPase subunit type 1 TsaE [Schwartzia sp. (in: firmicutes)]